MPTVNPSQCSAAPLLLAPGDQQGGHADADLDGQYDHENIDEFREAALEERRADEGHGAQIRLGECRRIAELTQHVGDGLAALQALGDVPSQLHGDLRPQGRAARQLVEHAVDVVVSGRHWPSLSCRSSFVMAFANVVHSCLSESSSARPASVRR